MAVEYYVGFDDEDSTVADILHKKNNKEYSEEEKDYNNISEEDMKVYISPKRQSDMLAEYDCVVVNDFGDEYHLSEEERIAQNQFYDAFKILRRAKRSYRKLPDFVTVFRQALKCLDMVAEKNYSSAPFSYTPEKFKSLVMKGKIEVNGLFFPKYKGKDRKQLDWNYIADFILSNEPVEKLLPEEDELITDEELEKAAEDLFTKERFDEIFNHELSDEDKIKCNMEYDPDSPPSDDAPVAYPLTRKEFKDFLKVSKEYPVAIKNAKRKSKSSDMLDSYAYELTISDLETIENYDRRRIGKLMRVKEEIPEFKGSVLNDKDYKRYMYQLNEYEDTVLKEEYNGKFKTRDEINELEMKEALELAGWNVRKALIMKDEKDKIKKSREKTRKRQKKIRDKLIKLKNKSSKDKDDKKSTKKNKGKRMQYISSDTNKKKKSDKKKDKKKNKKEEKVAKKIFEQNKSYKKRVKEATDDLIMSALNKNDNHDSFKDYEEDVLDCTWENIIKDEGGE